MDAVSIVGNVAEMFSGRGLVPWHGLGQVVQGLLSAKEAIKAAHLNWKAVKLPIYWEDHEGKRHEYGTKRVVVRQDIGYALGEVTTEYEILQNEDAFAFFDEIVGEGRAVYDTAGALFGGKQIWISAKLNPEDFKDQMKDEKFDRYVMLFNNFAQGQQGHMRHCTTRPVCYNTVTAAISEGKTSYSFRHAGNLKAEVEAARNALGIITEQMRELEKCLAELRGIKFTMREMVEFTEELTDVERNRVALPYLFKNGLGCEGKNRYDAFNAVTQLTTHHLQVRGSDPVKAERLMDSSFNGRGRAMQRRALALLVP